MHLLLRTAVLVAVAYGCYAALLFAAQRWFIYPGRAIRVAPQPPAAAGLERLWLESAAGRTEAWFLPGEGRQPGRRQPVVLLFHGNGEVIDYLPQETGRLRAMGVGVLLVEYPGFGRSGGAPSEESITATAVAAYAAVAGRPDVDPGRIAAFGRSLGSGAACALALRQPLRALVLQAPFTSTRPFARRMLLPGFLVRDVFDNRAALERYPGPVLILHGRHDDVVPFGHGEELARVARRARLVPLACAHNDCPPDEGGFWRTVEAFLRESGVL